MLVLAGAVGTQLLHCAGKAVGLPVLLLAAAVGMQLLRSSSPGRGLLLLLLLQRLLVVVVLAWREGLVLHAVFCCR